MDYGYEGNFIHLSSYNFERCHFKCLLVLPPLPATILKLDNFLAINKRLLSKSVDFSFSQFIFEGWKVDDKNNNEFMS